jgi:hypothetical protein
VETFGASKILGDQLHGAEGTILDLDVLERAHLQIVSGIHPTKETGPHHSVIIKGPNAVQISVGFWTMDKVGQELI